MVRHPMMGWTAQSQIGFRTGHCHGKELGQQSRWQERELLHGLKCSALQVVKLYGVGCPGRQVLRWHQECRMGEVEVAVPALDHCCLQGHQ